MISASSRSSTGSNSSMARLLALLQEGPEDHHERIRPLDERQMRGIRDDAELRAGDHLAELVAARRRALVILAADHQGRRLDMAQAPGAVVALQGTGADEFG